MKTKRTLKDSVTHIPLSAKKRKIVKELAAMKNIFMYQMVEEMIDFYIEKKCKKLKIRGVK